MLTFDEAQAAALDHLHTNWLPNAEIRRYVAYDWGWLFFYNAKDARGEFPSRFDNFPLIIDREDGAIVTNGFSLKDELYAGLYAKYRQQIRDGSTTMSALARAWIRKEITLD